MTDSLKQKVYACCLEILENKIQDLLTSLRDLKNGAENDSKSSAGDKHETARAMMQLEYEKISKQLGELENQKKELDKIDIQTSSSKILNGSLIKANNQWMFLSVALGKITVEGIQVMVFSQQSPIGHKMIGRKEGDSIEMNGINYVIENIY